MDDKERADKLRAAIGILDDIGFDEQADDLRDELILINPPKPEYPDGLYRWTYGDGMVSHVRRSGGKWLDCFGQPDDQIDPPGPEGRWAGSVSRVRVLADDEVAVPVVTKAIGALRADADHLDSRRFGYGDVGAAVLRAYVEAVESTEAGDAR